MALFSATSAVGHPPDSTGKYLHDPVEVTVKAKTATAENITQLRWPARAKMDVDPPGSSRPRTSRR